MTALTLAEQGQQQTAKVDSTGLGSTQRTRGNKGRLRAEEMAVPREEHSSWCPIPNAQA